MGDSTEKKSLGWRPLVNFFVLGLLAFGLEVWFEKPVGNPSAGSLVEITSADIEWFRNLWEKRMGREPSGDEIHAQVGQLIREHILSREAERLGMGNNDELIRRRLAQKMDFFIKDMASGVQPSDQELQNFLNANRERYAIPGETSFEQVLFKIDQRGEDGAEEAVSLFLSEPDRDSDPTMLPRWNEELTDPQVERLFGRAFAEELLNIEIGKWAGPLSSSYGFHAVLIHERSPTKYPTVDAIRERLLGDWNIERQSETSDQAYEQFRHRYTVLVEGMPYTMDME